MYFPWMNQIFFQQSTLAYGMKHTEKIVSQYFNFISICALENVYKCLFNLLTFFTMYVVIYNVSLYNIAYTENTLKIVKCRHL